MPVLSSERLTRQLREEAAGGVFFLIGEEEHLKGAATRAIIHAHVDPGTRDFNLDEVRGTEVTPERLGSLIQTPPMMADWRVVVVRDAQGLAVSSIMRSILERVVASPPVGLALVLVADIGTSKAKIWSTVKKHATTVEFPRLSEADLPGWLMERARDEGFELEVDAARALGAAVGPDLATAVREMEKLRDYLGDRTTIVRADVVALVGSIPRQDRWEWIDRVAERRFDLARAGLPVLLDMGESGVGLVIALGNQMLRIAVCQAGGRDALESHLPPNQRWLARRVETQARGWTTHAIEDALDHLQRADRLLKSAPLSDLQIMEELLLRMQHEREEAA